MDVKSGDETALSPTSLVGYLHTAGALIAAGVLPTAVVPGHGDLIITGVLAQLLGLLGGTVVSALFTLSTSRLVQSVVSVAAFVDRSSWHSPNEYVTPSLAEQVTG